MDINYFCKALAYSSTGFSIMSFIIGIVCIKNIKGPLYPILVLAGVSFAVEIINFIFVAIAENNLFIFHLFTIIEFILLTLFYSRFFKDHFNSKIFYLLIPAFIIVAYTDYKINGLNTLDNLSTSIESIIMVTFALFLFFFIINKLIIKDLLSSPVFWINSGILVYFSGNIFLFAFSNYLNSTEANTYAILWAIINSLLNIIYNICLSIGFWKTRRTSI